MLRALYISIALNIVLTVCVGIVWLRPASSRDYVVSTSTAPQFATQKASVKASSTAPSTPTEIIAKLEQSGVPRRVIADALRIDHRLRWNKRVIDLENKYAPKHPPEREYLALQRLQDEDEVRQLKAALGEDGYAAWDKEETLRKLNFNDVPMSPAEADQAYQLQKQLDDKQRELRMALEDGDADIADVGNLQMQAQDAYERELEKLLGKDRYDELKGFVEPKVQGHMEFNEIDPTPQQVTALNAAMSDYDSREAALTKQLAQKPLDAAAIAAQLQSLNDAREDSIRNAVGSDTYEKLKREHDDTYQTLEQYASAWNLKDADLEPVYQKIKAYEDSADLLRKAAQLTELAGQTADWTSINAAIDQSRQQTEAALNNLIGADNAQRIERNGLLSKFGSDRNAAHRGEN